MRIIRPDLGPCSDEFYMKQALKQAMRAADADEVPVGAIVVDAQGMIVARAYNQTIKRASPLAHAELLAIQRAAQKQGDWRLDEHTLFVTLEPCALCMQAIIQSRLSRVVWGADSPLFGFSLDKYCSFDLYRMPLVFARGVCAAQAQMVLKGFFKKKRETLCEQGTNKGF